MAVHTPPPPFPRLSPQFPDSFEFDVGFLCDLADHVYSGWFGTFLFNSERERRTQALSLRSLSVWALLNAQRAKYLNPRCVSGGDVPTTPGPECTPRAVLPCALLRVCMVAACVRVDNAHPVLVPRAR